MKIPDEANTSEEKKKILASVLGKQAAERENTKKKEFTITAAVDMGPVYESVIKISNVIAEAFHKAALGMNAITNIFRDEYVDYLKEHRESNEVGGK